MQLKRNEQELQFIPAELNFEQGTITNCFAKLRPRKLSSLIAKDRYKHLADIFYENIKITWTGTCLTF